MIQEMIEATINNTIEKSYTHLRFPGSVYVKITKANKYSSYNQEASVKIDSISHSLIITRNVYLYNIKILKEDKTVDERYSEIPNIKSVIELQIGDIAVANLMYGKVNPFIVGKVI